LIPNYGFRLYCHSSSLFSLSYLLLSFLFHRFCLTSFRGSLLREILQLIKPTTAHRKGSKLWL